MMHVELDHCEVVGHESQIMALSLAFIASERRCCGTCAGHAEQGPISVPTQPASYRLWQRIRHSRFQRFKTVQPITCRSDYGVGQEEVHTWTR